MSVVFFVPVPFWITACVDTIYRVDIWSFLTFDVPLTRLLNTGRHNHFSYIAEDDAIGRHISTTDATLWRVSIRFT
jgi:hypothetical protein